MLKTTEIKNRIKNAIGTDFTEKAISKVLFFDKPKLIQNIETNHSAAVQLVLHTTDEGFRGSIFVSGNPDEIRVKLEKYAENSYKITS